MLLIPGRSKILGEKEEQTENIKIVSSYLEILSTIIEKLRNFYEINHLVGKR